MAQIASRRGTLPPAQRAAAVRRVERTRVRRPDVPDLRLDRLVVCPSGLYVVTGGEDAPEVLASARRASEVVADLLPDRYRRHVRPVLCRTDGAPVAETSAGVLVTSDETFDHVSRSSPVVLSTSEIRVLERLIDAGLEDYPGDPEEESSGRVLLFLVSATFGAAAAAAGLVAAGAVPLPW